MSLVLCQTRLAEGHRAQAFRPQLGYPATISVPLSPAFATEQFETHPSFNFALPSTMPSRWSRTLMPDGTIFAGRLPYTDKYIFVTRKDAPMTLGAEAAMEYAAALDSNGHRDWRLPNIVELNMLYQNRQTGALRGTFNETASSPGSQYWSSSPGPLLRRSTESVWVQLFENGALYPSPKDDNEEGAVRPIRVEIHP
jgi:hypothetical protein